jgi:ornithine cyclodeaminase
MHVLDGDELRRALPMSAAIDALEAGFRTQDPSAQPLRSHLATRAGSLLLMPAFGDGGVGVKLVTLTPDNPDRDLPYIGDPYAQVDAVTQTPRRSSTAPRSPRPHRSGVGAGDAPPGQPRRRATRDLRRRVQARSHLEAMVAVRRWHVTVVSRTPERSRALVAKP